MPQKPRRDVVPPTTRRSHRADDYCVHDRLPGDVLQVVPDGRVKSLTIKLCLTCTIQRCSKERNRVILILMVVSIRLLVEALSD